MRSLTDGSCSLAEDGWLEWMATNQELGHYTFKATPTTFDFSERFGSISTVMR